MEPRTFPNCAVLHKPACGRAFSDEPRVLALLLGGYVHASGTSSYRAYIRISNIAPIVLPTFPFPHLLRLEVDDSSTALARDIQTSYRQSTFQSTLQHTVCSAPPIAASTHPKQRHAQSSSDPKIRGSDRSLLWHQNIPRPLHLRNHDDILLQSIAALNQSQSANL